MKSLTHIRLELVPLLVPLNERPRWTFRSRASDLLFRILRILVHADPVDLVLDRGVQHHLTETFGKPTRLLEAPAAVVRLARTHGRTLFRES